MKYNEKYELYVDDDLVIYRWNKKLDKLMQVNFVKDKDGYLVWYRKRLHRIVYETFVGEIPQGYEIDHINTIRDDNRLENLRCVTHKENCNNPLTKEKRTGQKRSKEARIKMSEAKKGYIPWNKGKNNLYSEETRKKMSEARKRYWEAKRCQD